MTAIDGEYNLLGRKSENMANVFMQYGEDPERSISLVGGEGIQECEFIDGLKFSVESPSAMQMNVQIMNGVPQEALPAGARSLSEYYQLLVMFLKLMVEDSFMW